MQQLISFLLVSLLSFVSPSASPNFGDGLFDLGDEFFYPLENTDSIPWGIVTAITQDKEGFIWIGTQKGLLRFDGYEYKVFKHDSNNSNSPAGDYIYAILAASDGRLWFSTEAGISIFHPNTQQFKKLNLMSVSGSHSLSRETRAIVEQDQYIWLGTESGLLRVDQLSLNVVDLSRSGQHLTANVRALVYDSADWLWVGSVNGVYRINVNSMISDPLLAEMEYNVASLSLTTGDSLWVGTKGSGVYLIELDAPYNAMRAKKVVSPKGTALGSPNASSQPIVSNMLVVDSGEVWLSVRKHGIMIFDSQTGLYKKQLRSDALGSHNIRSNSVSEMFIDRAGLMWLGILGKGIDLHNTQNHAFKILSLDSVKRSGFDSTLRVNSVLEHPNGSLWLAGREFVISLVPGRDDPIKLEQKLMDQLSRFDMKSTGSGISGISMLPDGELLLVLSRGSIFRYNIETEVVSLISDAANSECVNLHSPSTVYEHFVWIPCRYVAKLIRLDLRNNTLSYLETGVEGGALLQDANILDGANTLWVATKKGLFKALNATSDNSKLSSTGLSSQLVVGLLLDSADQLWVDTYQGLFWKGGIAHETNFKPLSDLSNLARDQTFGNMLEGPLGRIWGDEGVYDPATQHFEKFQLADGFKIGPNWLAAHTATQDGLLLFGADDQLLMVQTKKYKPWQYVPALVVTQQFVDGELQRLTNAKSIVLPPHSKSFSIDVAALDYSAPMNNLYRHRLQGFDDRWIDSDAKHRRINYTNLAPGDYMLEVVASNRTGRFSSKGLEIHVQVLHAWYQTIWLKGLLVIVACLLIYGLIYIRSRQLRIRQMQLEQLVDLRTKNLKETQSKLLNSEKQASLGRLVRGVAHELNTPLGILITGVSMVENEIQVLQKHWHDNQASDKIYANGLQQMQNTTVLLKRNIRRSVDLVENFKLVAAGDEHQVASVFNPKQRIEMILSQYDDSGLTIKIFGSADLEIESYPLAFSQIINELILNSLQHGFDLEGKIDGQTHLVPNFTVSFWRRPSIGERPPCFELEVSDTGMGMSNEMLNQCFDPFVTSATQSVGLGLHILFNIVTLQLQGQAECYSELGFGTRFKIYFPLLNTPTR